MPQCLSPYTLKHRDKLTGEWQVVPCGWCPICVKKYASGWSFRLMQEERVSDSAYFITLTYSPDDLIVRAMSKLGLMTLRKRDFQDFMKRLRKRHSKHKGAKPIKYYAVGEYGSQFLRPHYHAVVFNAWMEDIEASWMLGYIHYGTVTGASVGYTLKYMCKKNTPVGKADNDDREPEFGLMSKRLGASYFNDEVRDHHLSDLDRMYLVVEGGKKVSMPRYYKDRLFNPDNFPSADDAKSLRAAAGHFALQRMRAGHDNMLSQYEGDWDWDSTQANIQLFHDMERKSKEDKL